MLIAAIVFVVVMVIGLPIAFALGLMGTVHMLSLGNESYLLVIIQRLFDQVDLISLTCLPFFIMAGEIMNAGGVTTRLLDFAREIVGRLKAGSGILLCANCCGTIRNSRFPQWCGLHALWHFGTRAAEGQLSRGIHWLPGSRLLYSRTDYPALHILHHVLHDDWSIYSSYVRGRNPPWNSFGNRILYRHFYFNPKNGAEACHRPL